MEEKAVGKEGQGTAAGKGDGGVLREVEMHKGSVGLGFCIEGGSGSPLGDRPIAVKRLFKGEPRVKRFDSGNQDTIINW